VIGLPHDTTRARGQVARTHEQDTALPVSFHFW
jgi:hypothetical protein